MSLYGNKLSVESVAVYIEMKGKFRDIFGRYKLARCPILLSEILSFAWKRNKWYTKWSKDISKFFLLICLLWDRYIWQRNEITTKKTSTILFLKGWECCKILTSVLLYFHSIDCNLFQFYCLNNVSTLKTDDLLRKGIYAWLFTI